MKNRSAFILLTLAVLLIPGLAAAEPASAPLPETDLSWLSCPAAGPQTALSVPALPAAGPTGVDGLEGAVALALVPDCCASRLRKCQQDCWDTGVASFVCSQATCATTWSCTCN